jgi:guanine deaminase
MTIQSIRGRCLIPRAGAPVFSLVEDALVQISAGRIFDVGPAPSGCTAPITRPGALWMPAFVDTHVHCPQTRIRGSATGPLLDWLQQSVFPEEARLRDPDYARTVAREFCRHLLQQGTTCAAIYSTSDAQATDILFEELAAHGIAGHVGLTLMDQGAPNAICVPAEQALADAERLISKWHGHENRLFFAITPRFALSCTPALMRGAAALAKKHDLLIQAHLSENPAEIAAVGDMYPAQRDYLDVYAAHGLCGRHSLFAHCVHLNDDAWDRLAAADAAVSHCPDSNFFLGSGCMPLAAPIERGIRLGLGTDVGAGRTFSLRRVAASAYDAALITGATVTSEALLWFATRGGGDALRLPFGRIEVDGPADLVAIDDLDGLTGAPLFDALVHRRDAGPVADVWSSGRSRAKRA